MPTTLATASVDYCLLRHTHVIPAQDRPNLRQRVHQAMLGHGGRVQSGAPREGTWAEGPVPDDEAEAVEVDAAQVEVCTDAMAEQG